MKKILLTVAAIAALASCTQEMNNIEPQQPKGQTVTINCVAAEDTETPDVKAAIGKDGKNILWRDYDKISVLVKSGTTWSENTLFERIKDADNKVDPDPTKDNIFTGTFATQLAEEPNTWYLLHPYSNEIAGVGLDNKSRTIYKTASGDHFLIIENAKQDYSKGNKMGHLNLPMYGIGEGNGATTPTIKMHHFCGVFEITVTNNLTEAINVTSVIIDNPEDKITGDFRVKINDKTDTEPASMNLLAASKSSTSSELAVTNCSLAPNEVGKFYLLAKDFGLKTGSKITVTIKTDKNYVVAVKKLKKDTSFKAGKIHRTSVNYENPSEYSKVCPVGTKINFNKNKGGVQSLPTYIIQNPNTGKVNWYKESRLRLSNDANIIIPTDETPSKILVTAVEDNKNGKTASTLRIYGSTDGKTYTLLIDKKDLQNISINPDTAKPITFEVPNITAGMTYFKFENNKTDSTGNRSVCLNEVDFQAATTAK